MRNILAEFVTQGSRRPVVFPKKAKDSKSIKCVRIKRFKRTQDAKLILNDFEVTASTEDAKPCPLFEEYGSEHFLLLQFDKSCRQSVIDKVVKSGLWVKVDGEVAKTHYKFFGHTPTQLRNTSCLLHSTDLERKYGTHEQIISKFGTFSMNNVSKKAARIGLLLSTAKPAVLLDDSQVIEIEDVKHKVTGFNFTDGCGLISPEIAAKINDQYELKYRQQYEQQVYKFPSVYQIRFKGCKGILVLHTTLTNKIALRESLIKFTWNPEKKQNWLRIVEEKDAGGRNAPAVSFPNCYSSINVQFIRLLSALGVPDDVFLRKLDTYFEELSRILQDQEVQVRHLCANRRYDMAERILTTKSVDDETLKELKHYQMVCRMYKPRTTQMHSRYNQTKEDKIKVKVPLDQSRLVFGVADISGKLEYGCCYFQPTIRGKPTVLEGVRVVVAKNPSYHVGDIRVLECVNIPECRYLVDCLVFPVNGQSYLQTDTI